MSKTQSKEEQLIELLEKKGQVTLKAHYGKTQGAFIACPVIDPVTRTMRGVKQLSEEDKKKEIRVVDFNTTRKITDGITFHKSNPVDVIDWAWLVYNKEIAASRKEALKDEIVLFYVDDHAAEVEEKLSRKELVLEASMAVKKLSADNKVRTCRLLGTSVSHLSPQEISTFLYDKAEKFPEKIINIIKDKDADAKILVHDFLDAKVITQDEETGVYLYGNTKLGSKFETLVAWVSDKENSDVVKEMRTQLLPI